MKRYGATTLGYDPPQEERHNAANLVIPPDALREARLCTEMSGFGLPDREIASTLNISEDDVSLRIWQYWSHTCNYGAFPFTACWRWYALRRDPHLLAVPGR